MTAARQVDWAEYVDVYDMVEELTRPHDHQEPFEVEHTGRAGTLIITHHRHRTRVPPLLQQLEHSVPSSISDDRGSGGLMTFESRPAARLEVLDALIRIDHDAEALLKELDPGRTPPAETAVAVARLGGLLPGLDRCHRAKALRVERKVTCCRWHRLEGDIRRWWTMARIVAGWESPAWTPNAACPLCSTPGSLRVRLAARIGLCTKCHETWDSSTIELLGRHIREESFRHTIGRLVEPCWCPWPTPVERMGPLCPRCASARCHRAITAAMEAEAHQGQHAGRLTS